MDSAGSIQKKEIEKKESGWSSDIFAITWCGGDGDEDVQNKEWCRRKMKSAWYNEWHKKW